MEYTLVGNQPSVEKIRELITVVSDTAFNVLLLGETGTGKEVVARLLHQASSRRDKRFVKVNCAALPLNLLESELFGYEKGAFTGADRLKPGKFEQASGGVIFLDEIGDMPLVLQSKLLHVLQSGEFNRLGGTKDLKVNAWIISSTNHDLEEDMKKDLFREDLYYRLNIIKIELPPLRERKDDIPLLTEHFIKRCREDLQMGEGFTLNGDLEVFFQSYHWPGNVRELFSSLLRLMMGDDPELMISGFMKNMAADGVPMPAGLTGVPLGGLDIETKPEQETGIPKSLKTLKTEATDYIERKTILHALDMVAWNKREAAKLLQISYKALFNKINSLGIEKRHP